MDFIPIERIEEFLKKNLTEKRYAHSLGVAKMAVDLAEIYGVDVRKTYIAAIAHDIAKCYDTEDLNRMIRLYGIEERFLNNQALAHSKVGAAILEHEFGIKDQEILDAVSFHTTGRYGMSPLEEIIFVSDAIEQNRTYQGVRRLRQLVKFDLHEVCLEIVDYTINSVLFKKRTLDPDTLGAKRYMKERLNAEDERN